MSKTLLYGTIVLAVAAGAHLVWAQTPSPPSPKDFVSAATQSDQYEMLAAHVAEAQSKDPRVRTFAQDMIRDHERLSDELRKVATAARLPAPAPGMSSD